MCDPAPTPPPHETEDLDSDLEAIRAQAGNTLTCVKHLIIDCRTRTPVDDSRPRPGIGLLAARAVQILTSCCDPVVHVVICGRLFCPDPNYHTYYKIQEILVQAKALKATSVSFLEPLREVANVAGGGGIGSGGGGAASGAAGGSCGEGDVYGVKSDPWLSWYSSSVSCTYVPCILPRDVMPWTWPPDGLQ